MGDAAAKRRLRLELASRSSDGDDVATVIHNWPTRSIHPLEERIAMLDRARSSTICSVVGAVLIVTLLLGTGYTAWPQMVVTLRN